MAEKTDVSLRNQVIYCVYVRNHTEQGTFRALEQDLPRIAALGVTIIWLMPIHPVNEVVKRGAYGCPYSIRDYRAICEDYGSLADFHALVDRIHALGMRVIIDVVYNHTSRDSVLLKEHPEYFYRNQSGDPINRVPDWDDVVDLNYNVEGLWDYQIETLRYWAEMVDGFRCDVAPMVPLSFWKKAISSVAQVNPQAIWLAEVGGPGFMRWLERLGCPWWCENELLTAFDMTYDYDGHDHFKKYLSCQIPLSEYTQYLCNQNGLNPRNYVKLRFLENHDQPRAKERIPMRQDLINFTAFYYFLLGPALIYAGGEFSNDFSPSLFEKQPIDRSGEDLSWLFTALSAIKRLPIFAVGYFDMWADDEKNTAIGTYRADRETAVGVFCLRASRGTVRVPLPDGQYVNQIDGKKIKIYRGRMNLCHCPAVIITQNPDSDLV